MARVAVTTYGVLHGPAPVGRAPLGLAELDRIANTIRNERAEGYPAASDRLRLTSPGLRVDGARLIVPDGPWHVTGHPNRRNAGPDNVDPEIPAPGHECIRPDLMARWIADGLNVDQYGRPIHPHWQQLLADPRIGLPTGAGYFWRYGPNATVDAAVYRRRAAGPLEILLIQRRDCGRWALPGGFRDRADNTAEDTARRELTEETGLVPGGWAETIAHTRSVGPMATLHAWTENTVVLIHGDSQYLADATPVPGDDAIDAQWATPATITGLDLFRRHREYIATALNHLHRS